MVQNDSHINELMTFVFSFLKKAPLEKINAPLLVSPWLADRHQASERERELERLVFMLVNHTSHTDLKSPVSDCPLCEKVGGLWVVRIISLCC